MLNQSVSGRVAVSGSRGHQPSVPRVPRRIRLRWRAPQVVGGDRAPDLTAVVRHGRLGMLRSLYSNLLIRDCANHPRVIRAITAQMTLHPSDQ